MQWEWIEERAPRVMRSIPSARCSMGMIRLEHIDQINFPAQATIFGVE